MIACWRILKAKSSLAASVLSWHEVISVLIRVGSRNARIPLIVFMTGF